MSDKTHDGGPAFPFVSEKGTYTGHDFIRERHEGMTLRDWFAGQALITVYENLRGTFESPEAFYQSVAENAYAMADAMLVARER